MIKKIVIAGCRNYNNYSQVKKYIDYYIQEIRKKYTLIFLSGDCVGVDKLGERYANEHGLKIEKYPANWKNTVNRQVLKEMKRWL